MKTTTDFKWFRMAARDGDRLVIDIYDYIGEYGFSAKTFVDKLSSFKDVKSIELHINSPGGSVFDGIAIYNRLQAHQARVEAYVDGIAASIASVILCAGDSVSIPENAFVMIHNPTGFVIGESDDMKKMSDVLDRLKKSITGIYAKRSGKAEKDIEKLMDEETWFNGREAVENGFADEVTAGIDLDASFDVQKLTNVTTRAAEFVGALLDSEPKQTRKDTPMTKPANQKNGIFALLASLKEIFSAERALELLEARQADDQEPKGLEDFLPEITAEVKSLREQLTGVRAELKTAQEDAAGKATEIASLKDQITALGKAPVVMTAKKDDPSGRAPRSGKSKIETAEDLVAAFEKIEALQAEFSSKDALAAYLDSASEKEIEKLIADCAA